MLKVAILATSSAGNSSFVSDGTTRLLVDCGLTMQETARRLTSIGEELDAIDAVLLTHPHTDHAGGLGTLIRHWRRAGCHVPVYCSGSTAAALPKVIPPHWFRPVAQFDHREVGGIHVETFAVEHDTGEPLGFAVEVGKVRAAFALDLGTLGGDLADYLADSDLVLLESNHDPDMLYAGPYEYRLKQRIMKTHLSNEKACAWISEHMTRRTKHLLLGHLSTTTNDPEIVRLMARQQLDRLELKAELEVISPGQASGPWVLGSSPDPGTE